MPKAGKVRWAEFRVAVVAVVSVAILGTLLYELYGSMLAPKAAVYLYVPDATGLSGESPVRVDGVDVGRVSAVALSGSNQPGRVVKVTISIQRDRLATIPADSVTQISSDSLVGDKFVDVASGTSPKPIPPEGELIYKDQPELLKSLDLTQFTRELRLLDATLTDLEEGRSEFGKFFHGTQMLQRFDAAAAGPAERHKGRHQHDQHDWRPARVRPAAPTAQRHVCERRSGGSQTPVGSGNRGANAGR